MTTIDLSKTPASSLEEKPSPEEAASAILKALNYLPPEYLPDVLQFVQFLIYKFTTTPDSDLEDEALWDAVQANQRYKELYPDEEPERYKSGEEFLRATADL